ncbi:MAG: UvrB/UvrC motif-containing protein [Phycisphaerales bacterium]|nr:UvrB/UvrC motif-containing protein [Planctomycetota bacterium]MBL6997740.1 UvrB/UvrC motif-containing protein [Phycisphaerales bacterium]
MTSCDHCDKPAIYHDVRIANGVHNTTHLCAEHAMEAGVSLGPIDLSVVLHSTENAISGDISKACPDCGMTVAQYKKTSLLGCPSCYQTFSDELNSIITQVQNNNTQHIGRAPAQASVDLTRHLQIRRLLKKLESAVSQEEYEQAAILRDKLRELHTSGEPNEN